MQAGYQSEATYREGYVDANGLRIRFVERGQGRPVVLLRGADDLALPRFIDLLAQHHRVISLELPGFSATPEDPQARRMRDLARAVSTAADQLGLDRFGVVSFGFSARSALWLALDAPERVDALVLISPAAIVPAGCEPDGSIELEDRLGLIESQTLVVFGTNDEVSAQDMGRLYKERMPNCYLVFVYDAGHAVAAQRPEALAGVVSDFLERRETFIVSRTNTMINP